MARGGRRQGVQGRAYGNRTDLSMNARPLPVQTATNQPYGVAGAQAAGQAVVPLAPTPQPGAAGAPGAGAVSPTPAPGSLGAFDRPSDRPNEPITHGAPFGPGGGPEVMGMEKPILDTTISNLLSTLAAQSGSTELAELAQHSLRLGGR